MPKITKSFIDKVALPADGYALHWDDSKDPRGYGLRVNAKGTKSFVFQGRLRGTSILYTIGKFGDLTEQQARQEARDIRDGLRKGIDPRDVRRKPSGMTLTQLAGEYIARPTVNMKARSRDAIMRHVNTSWEAIKDKPIGAITEDYVRRRYDYVLNHGLRGDRKEGAKFQAKQAHAVLSAMLNYAVMMDLGITVNPCAKVVNKHNRVASTSRDTFIQQSAIGKVWNWINEQRAQAYTQGAMGRLDLARWLLLTGCRLSEALELTWDRVSLADDDPFWHLADPKNRQPYWVPMSTQALAMMKVRRAEVPKNVQWVFPSYRSKSGHMEDPREMLWNPISAITGEAISAHDCRRSFSIYGLMDCRIEKFRIDLLTCHKPVGVLSQHYAQIATQRLQWLRPEVQQIADWIERQAAIAAASNVVQLRKAS
jgi:integrase